MPLTVGLGVAVLIIIATLLAAALWWNHSTYAPQMDRASVAVLPFINASREPQQDYFGDGLTEDLIASLGRFTGIFVIGGNSAFAYKGKSIPAKQIGHELGVRYLVQGSVRRDGDRLRITSELIDATTNKQLWAESYDGASNRIFAVQDEVTRNIVTMLVAHVNRSELARVLRKPSDSLDAYDHYLRGKALITMRHGDNRGTMLAQARDFLNVRSQSTRATRPPFKGSRTRMLRHFSSP
jgi:adenylate cyclase